MKKMIKLCLVSFLSVSLFFCLSDIAQAGGKGSGRRSGGSYKSSSSGSKSIKVKGYTRKDGTYVAPHYRSAPKSKGTSYTPSKSSKISVPSPKSSSSTPSKSSKISVPSPKSSSSTPSKSSKNYTTSSSPVVKRDSKGRIMRSSSAVNKFKQQTGYPNGRPGYIIDHIIPLKRGGADSPENMQWQTKEEAKAKDKIE